MNDHAGRHPDIAHFHNLLKKQRKWDVVDCCLRTSYSCDLREADCAPHSCSCSYEDGRRDSSHY